MPYQSSIVHASHSLASAMALQETERANWARAKVEHVPKSDVTFLQVRRDFRYQFRALASKGGGCANELPSLDSEIH